MGFLAPLYIAGALAIGLPILFHLIRRAPHGRQEFSSLMFLAPSPPRLTRRSRLTNIVLLILRALAVILLALAFARPFLAGKNDFDTNPTGGRRVAVLVDTSASMKRGDLWAQAGRQLDAVLKDVTPADELALYTFDRQLQPAFTFAEWRETHPERRVALLKSRLPSTGPTWAPTRLGDALAAVADVLGETESKDKKDTIVRQVVLISDMQQGGRVEALQGHEWPGNVLLDVRPVESKQKGNASLQVVKQTAEEAEKPDGKLRVRVTNQADSTKENLTLAWANENGPVPNAEPQKVYVAPGRSQIVRVSWPNQGQRVDRLVLAGDESDFDNTLYVVPPRVESVRVLFVGNDAADDPKGLRYYLQSVLGDTARRKVDFAVRRADEALPDTDLVGTRLVVVAAALDPAAAAKIKAFVEGGGDALWALKDAAGAGGLDAIFAGAVAATESEGDYALIARVDVNHPLFAPFADPRFGDFTKIRFWRHRKIQPPQGAAVLASFDNGDPFLIEQTIGKGRAWVATAGWHPADSQLALSTKFVPLIDGFVRRRDAIETSAQYAVFDPVALPQRRGTLTLTGPDGKPISIPPTATVFEQADRPGVYRVSLDGEEAGVAVNLAPDESRTTPLGTEDLERWGAKLGTKNATAEVVAEERRLRRTELEGRQKLWRWILLGVLGLLAAETTLAGIIARRARTEQVTT